jgi:excisionase family DNA binding protein
VTAPLRHLGGQDASQANGRRPGRKSTPPSEDSGPSLDEVELRALLDVEACAQILGVTIHHVRRLVQEKRIPYLKVGAFVRFDPRDVVVWLEERRVPEYASPLG